MDYCLIREGIKTGDVILWEGRGIVPRIIALYGGYSHASLVVRLEKYEGLKDRVFLVEAVSSGLEFRLLSKRLEEYKGKAWHYAVGLTPYMQDAARTVALNKCAEGVKYDFKSVFKNVFSRVSVNASLLFCSEVVWWVWEKIDFVAPGSKAPRPGDIPKRVKGTLIEIEV